MDDSAIRATAIAKAHSLLLREGDKFTLELLCTETGLSEASLRHVFPNKAALISAVLNEAVADAEHHQSGIELAQLFNHCSSVATDTSCANTDSASQNSDATVHANSPELAATAVEDEWVDSRCRAVESAIASLDALLERRREELFNAVALLDQKLTEIINARTGSPATVEPPPFITEQDEQDADIETTCIDSADSTSVTAPGIGSISCPTQNLTLGNSPCRLQMLTIIEGGRRPQGDATWTDRLGFGYLRIGPVEVGAAIFAGLLTIAGLFWVHDRARATESPAVTAKRVSQEPSSVRTGMFLRKSSCVVQGNASAG